VVPQSEVQNSQRSPNSSISRPEDPRSVVLQGQQAHCQVEKLSNVKTATSSLTSLGRPSGLFIYFKRKSVACLPALVVGGREFGRPWDPSNQKILPSLRILTNHDNEAEQTLDSPTHGAARACSWLSTALVDGSVRRGRGRDQYSHCQRRSHGGGSGPPCL